MLQTGSSTITYSEQAMIVNPQQTSCAGPILFPVKEPTLSQIITTKTLITAEVW